ncbi:uncharacterized protein TNCV_1967281 [Trichonephila clavipes]|nr:uncharacterized protein TNCV_1967281 [Trichonephila clavipes]
MSISWRRRGQKPFKHLTIQFFFYNAKRIIKKYYKEHFWTKFNQKNNQKVWFSRLLHISKWPRDRAVADFRITTGHDCLSNRGSRVVAGFVTSSSPVPLETHRVGQLCTLNLSRAETYSRWCGVVVRRGGASSGVVHVTFEDPLGSQFENENNLKSDKSQ